MLRVAARHRVDVSDWGSLVRQLSLHNSWWSHLQSPRNADPIIVLNAVPEPRGNTSQRTVVRLAAVHAQGIRAPIACGLHPLQRTYAKKQKQKHQSEAESTSQESGHQMPSKFELSPYEDKMQAAVEHLYHELTGVRTGRASTAMLDTVGVEVYGEKQSLTHVATVLMRGPRMLAVTVYDASNTGAVMDAIRLSPLKLDPRIESGEIVVPVPEMSPETQRAMTKLAHQFAEQTRVAVRQVRHKAMAGIKSMAKSLTEDERKQHEKEVDDLTKRMVHKVAEALARKEAELR